MGFYFKKIIGFLFYGGFISVSFYICKKSSC